METDCSARSRHLPLLVAPGSRHGQRSHWVRPFIPEEGGLDHAQACGEKKSPEDDEDP